MRAPGAMRMIPKPNAHITREDEVSMTASGSGRNWNKWTAEQFTPPKEAGGCAGLRREGRGDAVEVRKRCRNYTAAAPKYETWQVEPGHEEDEVGGREGGR